MASERDIADIEATAVTALILVSSLMRTMYRRGELSERRIANVFDAALSALEEEPEGDFSRSARRLLEKIHADLIPGPPEKENGSSD